MRRVVFTVVAVVVVVAVAFAVHSSTGSGDSYQVAAIFDNADSIVGGSQVKIAGAVVGSVTAVQLRTGTASTGPTARIVMSINSRFAPFHANATCTLLPEGLISENYVECDPGSASAPALRTTGSSSPTVQLSGTTVPLTIQQVINVFSMPTDDRLQAILAELGIATAGRGEDINAILERSNPALEQAQRVLGILDSQRAELAHGISASNAVLSALAENTNSVREFVDHSAQVSRTTAAHGSELSASIARFPALLTALKPALVRVDRVAVEGTPVLASLHIAAPLLDELTQRLPPFLTAGTHALPSLTAAGRTGIAVVRQSTAMVSDLKSAAVDTIPAARDTNATLISIRNTGGLEEFLRGFYSLATASAGYDSTSHFQTAFLSVLPQCMQSPPGAGCSNEYNSPGEGAIPANDPSCGPQADETWLPATDCVAGQQVALLRKHRTTSATRTPTGPAGTTTGTATATTTPTQTATTTTPLSNLGTTINKVLGSVGAGVSTTATKATAPLQGLLNYLVGK